MSRLFVFAIGGTGARVLKAFTMLSAAGVQLEGCDMVVPILIDPHKDLAELKDVKHLLDLYLKVHRPACRDYTPDQSSAFFRNKILTLNEIDGTTGTGFDFDERIDESFGDFIGYNTLAEGDTNKELIDLLYSEQTLNAALSVGFKGNPNIGAVVLNTFEDVSWFRSFESIFDERDKVFIICSLFGGTGAAGFPLLYKKLRSSSSAAIRNATIGALPVMPYFKLNDPDPASQHKEIDSNNFFTKTKSALSYYEGHLKGINALYYLADPHEQSKPYVNDEQKQENKAHLVELIGASALFHFAARQPGSTGESFFQYSLKEDKNHVTFYNIGNELRDDIYRQLTNFYVYSKISARIKATADAPVNVNEGFDGAFYRSDFIRSLEEFTGYFARWIGELNENDRKFGPFNTLTGDSDFHKLVIGNELSDKALFGFARKKFDASGYLNQMEVMRRRYAAIPRENPYAKYLAVAHGAIDTVNSDKFKYQAL